MREKIANVTAYLQETLSGVRVVRAFGQEPRHVERFAELNDEHRAANMRTVHLNATYFPGVELLSAIGTAVILLYGGYQALDGDITIGVLVAFVGYLQSFFDPIQQLSNLYVTYQQGMAAIDKIFDLLDTGARHADARARASSTRSGARSSSTACRSATRRCRPDGAEPAWALRDVTLAVRPARRSRWSARPGPASRRSRSWSRGSTTRSAARAGGRPRPARGDAGEPAQPARDRAAGGLPVRRAPCGRTSSSGGPGRASSSWSRRARAVGAHEFIKAAAGGLRDRRSASAAAGCRPASGSSSRWRGR